jgi:hypothetical protein
VRIAFNKSSNYKRNPKVFYFTLSLHGHDGQLTYPPIGFTNFKKNKKKKTNTGPSQVLFEKKKGPNELETKKRGFIIFKNKFLIKIKKKESAKKNDRHSPVLVTRP